MLVSCVIVSSHSWGVLRRERYKDLDGDDQIDHPNFLGSSFFVEYLG